MIVTVGCLLNRYENDLITVAVIESRRESDLLFPSNTSTLQDEVDVLFYRRVQLLPIAESKLTQIYSG
jgi:hypothetical protein